jgi:hypothetical protein
MGTGKTGWTRRSVEKFNSKAGEPSDPYLIGFYDDRSLEISHDSSEPVTFKIEVEPVGHGPWMLYKEVTVNPDENLPTSFLKTSKHGGFGLWLIKIVQLLRG